MKQFGNNPPSNFWGGEETVRYSRMDQVKFVENGL